MEWSATVYRCNCLQAGFHVGGICPQAIEVPLGRVVYWHRNPLMRLWVLGVLPPILLVWLWTRQSGKAAAWPFVKAKRLSSKAAGLVVRFAQRVWTAIYLWQYSFRRRHFK